MSSFPGGQLAEGGSGAPLPPLAAQAEPQPRPRRRFGGGRPSHRAPRRAGPSSKRRSRRSWARAPPWTLGRPPRRVAGARRRLRRRWGSAAIGSHRAESRRRRIRSSAPRRSPRTRRASSSPTTARDRSYGVTTAALGGSAASRSSCMWLRGGDALLGNRICPTSGRQLAIQGAWRREAWRTRGVGVSGRGGRGERVQ